jgi:hypothetical protein
MEPTLLVRADKKPGGGINRQMAPRAEWQPFPAGPFPFPKFDRPMNAYLFRVLFPTPLKLALLVLYVLARNLKLRLQFGILRLQRLGLLFERRRLIQRQRKTLAEYVRHRNLFQGISGDIDQAHGEGMILFRPTGGNAALRVRSLFASINRLMDFGNGGENFLLAWLRRRKGSC